MKPKPPIPEPLDLHTIRWNAVLSLRQQKDRELPQTPRAVEAA